MEYPCIPTWMKPRQKDPFDYPLRSLEEMTFEQYVDPPLFKTKIIVNNYTAVTQMKTMHVHKSDKRNKEIRFLMRIEDMKLTPLQRKRLIFLLGPRYKNDGKVKIVMRSYDSFEENFYKACEIFQQLYWEAKRAPLRIWGKMTTLQRKRFHMKMIGKSKGPLPANFQEIKEKLYEEFIENQNKFKQLYESGEYTPQLILDEIQKRIDAGNQDKLTQEELKKAAEMQSKLESEYELKLAKERLEQNLVNQKVLSQKAYDIFFKKNFLKQESVQESK